MMYERVLDIEQARDRAPAWVDVLAVAGVIALGAWVAIPLPFSPVPMTLQTFSVLVAAFAVGRSRGTAGALLYLVLGLAGAPVFATASGATLGYLAAFVAVPSVVLWFRNPATGIIAATLLIYASGAVWLSLWLGCSIGQAVALGVLPFVPGDILKAIAAYRIAVWFQR